MSNKLESTSGYSHESPIINNKKADWTSTPDKWNNSMMEQDWKYSQLNKIQFKVNSITSNSCSCYDKIFQARKVCRVSM